MWNNLAHKGWYWIVAFLSLAVVLTGLGGGLFGQEGFWMGHWQHELFRDLCHQDPQRSFTLNGSPMAVCSRCIGIYSSFSLAWLLFPVTGRFFEQLRPYVRILVIIAISLNVLDLGGSILGFWENTLTSRYLLGLSLGASAVLIPASLFLNSKHSKTGLLWIKQTS